MAKIHITTDTTSDGSLARPRPVRARHLLVFIWIATVAVPWLLQVRSFSELVVRHKITQNLIPPPGAEKQTENVTQLCLVQALHLAGTWWNVDDTHYYKSDDMYDGSVLCHFIIPQYNIHGAYHIQNHKVAPAPTAPLSCANESYPVNYYFYHGSIGYYSFYDEGDGTFCSLDNTVYILSAGIGSSDINFSTLANFKGRDGYHMSYYFACVGMVWLGYRAIVLTRSYISCSQYARRLDSLDEPISLSSAIVFIQQASRIAPHTATNWHRLGLLYLHVEGLMTDLFLVIAHDGFLAKVQYISLGYNISGLLSMLFEIVENIQLLKPQRRLLIKRLLFNTEMTMWGEMLFSAAMSHYLSGLNRSDLRRSKPTAQAVSYYAWSLVGHGIVVLGQTTSILTFRATGTALFVLWRFGSLKMLNTPCCVDLIMGYRYKLAKLSGYEYHHGRLCYDKETLKAHGLLKMTDLEGKEFLVYHRIHWLPSAQADLAILGKLIGEHVEPCPESAYAGPVDVCDRMLGGATDVAQDFDDCDDFEDARLVDRSIRPSDTVEYQA